MLDKAGRRYLVRIPLRAKNADELLLTADAARRHDLTTSR
jgi:hypothetical protein